MGEIEVGNGDTVWGPQYENPFQELTELKQEKPAEEFIEAFEFLSYQLCVYRCLLNLSYLIIPLIYLSH